MTRQWQLASHASRQRHVTTLMWDTLARTKPRRNDHRAAPYQCHTRPAVGMDCDATELERLSQTCRTRCGMHRNSTAVSSFAGQLRVMNVKQFCNSRVTCCSACANRVSISGGDMFLPMNVHTAIKKARQRISVVNGRRFFRPGARVNYNLQSQTTQ